MVSLVAIENSVKHPKIRKTKCKKMNVLLNNKKNVNVSIFFNYFLKRKRNQPSN